MELDDIQLEKLERFLNGQMDAAEKNAFQQEIDASIALQEFIGTYNQLDAFEDVDNWPFSRGNDRMKEAARLFLKKDTIAFASTLNEANFQYQEHSKQTRGLWQRFAIVGSVAACIALLLYVIFPSTPDLNKMYVDHSSWEELPSLAVKGDSTEINKVILEQVFQKEDYLESAAMSEQLLEESDFMDPTLLLYLGVSQLELDQFDAALQTFTTLIESNTLDAHKGFWYTSLVYLKQGNTEAAIEALEMVVSNKYNYKYSEARKMLKALR